MKKGPATFLQVVLVLLGFATFALLLWEPRIEGVNVHATNFAMYTDPFILLVYLGSIPFFLALYQAFKVLGYTKRNKVFSRAAVKALRTIRYCAITIIGFVVMEEIFIMLTRGNDDAAGGIFMGALIALGSVVIAATAALFERVLRNAVEIKSENDLTV